MASGLARVVAPRFGRVPTLRHRVLGLQDPLAARLLPLLDGSRNVDALREVLAQDIRAGELTLHRDGQAMEDARDALAVLDEQLRSCLKQFLEAGVLEA